MQALYYNTGTETEANASEKMKSELNPTHYFPHPREYPISVSALNNDPWPMKRKVDNFDCG